MHTQETRDQPEFLSTGIKVDPDGAKRYRLHYKCYACYNKGTHYVYPTSKTTFCHRCRHEFSVEDAHPERFPNRDTFGNFFVAGDFKDWNVWS